MLIRHLAAVLLITTVRQGLSQESAGDPQQGTDSARTDSIVSFPQVSGSNLEGRAIVLPEAFESLRQSLERLGER